MKEDKVI